MRADLLIRLADTMTRHVGTPRAQAYDQNTASCCAMSYIAEALPDALRGGYHNNLLKFELCSEDISYIFGARLRSIGNCGEAGLLNAIHRIRTVANRSNMPMPLVPARLERELELS